MQLNFKLHHQVNFGEEVHLRLQGTILIDLPMQCQDENTWQASLQIIEPKEPLLAYSYCVYRDGKQVFVEPKRFSHYVPLNQSANEVLKLGKTVLYQTAPVLLENIIDYKLNKQKANLEDINKSVLETDLLIIDDLGTESLNSMKLSELFTIINTRILNLNHKITKTIISTNLNINEIFSKYEERIGSRIAGYYDIYCFFGDDIRFKKR